MLPELSDIKKLRVKYGMTQKDLSKLSGVSQSIIAKSEKGYCIPNYDTARKLFKALNEIESSGSLKASDLMTKKIISVKTADSIRSVANLLADKKISQCPVINDGIIIGSITEKSIINHLMNPKVEDLKVKDIIEEALPQLGSKTPLPVIVSLLEHYPAVIVVDNGAPKGIISKADLLKTI